MAVALAVAAAAAITIPELFRASMHPDQDLPAFYVRNLSLFVLPFLAAFFAWKRSLPPAERLWLATTFVVAAAVVNLMPFTPGGHTGILAALHLPMALWLVVGVAYTADRWRDHDQRMNFLRFSGECFIYYALIALGGGVLMALTAFVFSSIGLDPERLLAIWVLPCGAVGTVLVAAWLVEAKQSVIESMALAARDAGVGSLWLSLGTAPPAQAILGVPEGAVVVAIVAVGYPREMPPPPPPASRSRTTSTTSPEPVFRRPLTGDWRSSAARREDP